MSKMTEHGWEEVERMKHEMKDTQDRLDAYIKEFPLCPDGGTIIVSAMPDKSLRYEFPNGHVCYVTKNRRTNVEEVTDNA